MMKVTLLVSLSLAILCSEICDANVPVIRNLEKQCRDQGFHGVCLISIKGLGKSKACRNKLQCAVRVDNHIYAQYGGPIPDGTACIKKNMSCQNQVCVKTPVMPRAIGPKFRGLNCRGMVSGMNKIHPRPLSPLPL